jgi:hypothetical protein
VSELVPDVSTVVPDSAGGFPLQAVRSVPLLPVRHSATTAVARFLSRLNNAGDVASILLPHSTAGVVTVAGRAVSSRLSQIGAALDEFGRPRTIRIEQKEQTDPGPAQDEALLFVFFRLAGVLVEEFVVD